MKNNCKHKWVKTSSGYTCQKCSAIILTKDVIPVLGVILDSQKNFKKKQTKKRINPNKGLFP
jgi:Zn-finger protein